MPYQSWTAVLNSGSPQSVGAGVALSTATTSALSPQNSAAADYAVINAPSQVYGWYPGLILRVEARGILTTTATTSVATIFLASNKTNNGAAFVTLATPVGITTGTTALSGVQWSLEALIRCTAIASSGSTVSTQGELRVGNNLAALPANPIALSASPPPGMTLPIPNSGGETAAAVDTTVMQGIQLRGTLSVAGPSIQCTQWLVEALD